MSVIVAIKSGDAIYMGCDTQTTSGKDKENRLQESTFKISKLRSGMLVGICGKVAAHQSVCDDESVFEIENGELTKKEIVNNIILKIKAKLKDIAGDTSENERMPISIILAYKDKLFEVMRDYLVVGIEDYCSKGSGCVYTFSSLANIGLPIRERLLSGLRTSAKYCTSVSKPFVLIDTKELKYRIVEN